MPDPLRTVVRSEEIGSQQRPDGRERKTLCGGREPAGRDGRVAAGANGEVESRLAAFGPVFANDPALQFCLNASKRQLGDLETVRHWNRRFITQQRGMFSYSGLELEKVRRLRSDFGIYVVDSGRICVAAMNEKNIEYITDSIAKVL